MTRHYTHRIAVAFLIAAFSAPISAQQETVAEVWAKAEQGDAEAQSNLAIRYATGRGVPQDDAEAARWFRLAADQGHAEAQANLAIMYLDGRGILQDDAEAARWFRLAADQGHAFAQSNLGVMCLDGRGIPQDDAEAVRWFRLAADQGDAEAQANLAIMYLDGRGVPQNDVTAYMWFDLAATRSTGEVRDRAVWARATVAEELNASQRAKAKRLAREWDEAHPPVRPVTTVVYTDPRRR